jgi:ABC-type sugar transport system substrate-binding protein
LQGKCEPHDPKELTTVSAPRREHAVPEPPPRRIFPFEPPEKLRSRELDSNDYAFGRVGAKWIAAEPSNDQRFELGGEWTSAGGLVVELGGNLPASSRARRRDGTKSERRGEHQPVTDREHDTPS